MIVRAGNFCKRRVGLGRIERGLNASHRVNYKRNRQFFATSSISMMVDSGSMAKGGTTVDLLPEKEDDGGYVSGGWKR